MFEFQNIEKRKLIIYIVIAAIVFVLIGFFIYKNYSLTDQNNSLEANSESNNALNANKQKASEIKINKNEHLLYDDIFNDPKFQALQNNSITRTSKIKIGKANPFEPY